MTRLKNKSPTQLYCIWQLMDASRLICLYL